MNDDIISRQAALNSPVKMVSDGLEWVPVYYIKELPPAQPEPEEFEWCHTCREYDQEKHCCHRWTKVIRKTVDDMKAAQPGWIPVTERLPEESSPWRTGYLATVTCDTWAEPSVMYVQWETTTVRGKEVSRWIWNEKLFPKCWNLVAWMPLPKPWEGDTDAH